MSDTKIPFLAPPNAVWPQCILETRDDGCNFGHLVRTTDKASGGIYVQGMESPPGTPLFVCECKHWYEIMDIGTMMGIIGELESMWKAKWTVVLVFCVKLVGFPKT